MRNQTAWFETPPSVAVTMTEGGGLQTILVKVRSASSTRVSNPAQGPGAS